MNRLPILQDPELSESAREVIAGMQRRGTRVPDLYRLIANAPELLPAWTALSWPVRNSPLTSRNLRELLIMRTAHLTQSAYEWAHHWELALEAGVREEKLTALPVWRTSQAFDPVERAALDFADALVLTGKVPDAVFAALARHLNSAQLMHVAMTISFYICVAHVASSFELQLEPAYSHKPAMPERSGDGVSV
jgi:4-carboxymuconolactone decarboxylase